MAEFDMKQWLDKHVVPLLEPSLSIYHPFWNGIPPKDVLVVLMVNATARCKRCNVPLSRPERGIGCMTVGCVGEDAEPTPFDPAAWPRAGKRLLDEHDFRFDFTREQIGITFDGGLFNAFGGDGAPIFNKEGLASLRLFKKTDDGIGLIAQVACRYEPTDDLSAGEHASAATKAFYAQFEENPLEVCQKYGALFGQA